MKYLAYLILLIVGAGEMRAAVSSPIINSNQVYQLITNYAGSGSGPTNGFTGAQVTNSFAGLSALDGVATGTNQTIVFFIGDSMTANYAVNDVIPAAQNWSQYLPYFSGWSNKATYVNLSVPGISEVTVSNNWSTVYLPVINQYTNRNRIVVFSLGHNGNANGLTPAQQTNTFAALYTKARAAGAKAVAAPYTGSFFLNLPNKTNANIGIRLLYTNNVADYLIDFTVADNYLVEPTTPTHPSAFGSWLIASNANFNITIPASPIRIPLAQTFSGGATFIAPLGGAALIAKGSVIGTGIELVAEGTNGYGKSLPFWYARTSHVYRSVSEYVGPASYLYNKDAAGNDVSASGIGAAGVLDAPTIGWYFHRIIGSTNGFVVAGAGGATAFGVDGSGGIHHKGSVYNYSPNYFTDGSSNNTAAIGVGGSVASGAGPGSVSHRIIGTTNSYAVADNGGTRVLIVDGDTNGVTITRDLRPQAVKFDFGGVTYGALGLGGSVVAGNGDTDFGFRVTGTNRFSIGAGTGGTRAITVFSNSYVAINMPGTGDYVARDGSGNLFATNSGAAALTNVVNTFTGNSNIFTGPIYVGGVALNGGVALITNGPILSFSQSFWTNLTNWEVIGTPPVTNAGILRFTPSGNTWDTSAIQLTNYLSTADSFDIVATVRMGAYGNGFGIGMLSSNVYSSPSLTLQIAPNPTNSGITFWAEASGSPTTITNYYPNTGVGIIPGDTVRLTLSRRGLTLQGLLENVSKGSSAFLRYRDYNNQPNCWAVKFMSLAGTNDLASIHITQVYEFNPDLLVIGDSKTAGAFSYSDSTRYWSLVNPVGTISCFAGGANRTAEVLLSIEEILRQKPKKVMMNIGRNDLASGVSSNTWAANYTNIFTRLTTNGSIVYHLRPIPEITQDQSSLNLYLNSYSNTIDIATNWSNAAYLSSDNVHPNEQGALYVGQEIIRLNVFTTNSPARPYKIPPFPTATP